MKKKNLWAAGVLAAFLALLPVYPVRAEAVIPNTVSVDSAITMEITYGYDNAAKGGRYIPVEVVLGNTQSESFTGQLQVLTMESDYDIYRYDYPISIEAGESHRKLLDIPLGNRVDQLFVSVTDDSGTEIAHRRVKLNISMEIPELFIGVISDTPERLEYLNGVGVDYSMLRTKTFSLNEKNFPTDKTSLDLIDVILISNYRIRNLSSEQSQALIEWVRNGGTMILGTGARADDTLGRFAPELLNESYDQPQIYTVDMGLEDTAGGFEDNLLELYCTDFSLSGGNTIFTDGSLTLVSSVAYAKGVIAVAAYDFVDIEDFCEKNPSYIDALLTNVLGEYEISVLAEESYSGNSNQYWTANDMLNTGSVERLPHISLYSMEIIIYIFLAGPVFYIFLKQRELRKYYRTAIVLLSAVFTVIIYLMGSKTRFTDTFYNYARFIDTSEDTVSETVYLNMQTPYNQPFSTSLDSSYSIQPITRSYYDEVITGFKFTGQEEAMIAVKYEDDATGILVENALAFEPKYFQLERVEENTEHKGFTGEILIDGGKVMGSITNSFGESVEDATVLFYDTMIFLGDMEAGETRQLDDLEVLWIPLAHANQVAEKISGKDQYPQPDITNRDYMHALNKTNLLITSLDYMTGVYTPNARVIAVSSREEENPLGIDSAEVQGMTVVSSSINVYPYEDGKVYRSVLMKAPTVISGSYYSTNNTLYGIDPVVLEYSLGNDVEVEKLMLHYISETFTDETRIASLKSFTGSIYFYNHNTGNFDSMDVRQTTYTSEQLGPYLSPGNTITVKYMYSNTSEYRWDILLPVLNIEGRVY